MTSNVPPPRTARIPEEGKTSKRYSSAARISVPPPTTRIGRRPTSLGRLFIRASVLLLSISHPLCVLIVKAPPEEGAIVACPRREELAQITDKQVRSVASRHPGSCGIAHRTGW